MERRLGKRKFNKRIYILCQGIVSEVEYFKYFNNPERIKSLHIKIKSKHLTNALDFIKFALKNFKDEINQYDEFWLVFDKDETNDNDFNAAVNLAKKSKCKVAYSNQAFEIWFIHHFKEFSSPMDRYSYKTELSKLLEFEYDKSKTITKKVVEKLFSKYEDAIKNSEQSYNKFDHKSPASEESSTTVFKLAKSINEFKKK